jgi:hypothetical protein
MDELDLHGVRHRDADRLVENFVLTHTPPVRIITGNSVPMRYLVEEVLKRHGFNYEFETYWNLGSLIVNTV